MKKTFTSLFVIVLAVCLCVNVFAVSNTVTGTVTFDGKKLNTSYSSADFNTTASALQPGDDVTYTITLKNNHTAETDWYMYNIVKGFEDTSSVSGGAYIYTLRYSGPNNSRDIYVSGSVGGTGNTGLGSSTAALKDYFFLGSLKQGETGTVTLYIELDGETQNNDYFNKLADISMRFAVELTQTNNTDVVKTGDETQIMPYVIAATISGVLLLVIAILRMGKSRRNRRKGRA